MRLPRSPHTRRRIALAMLGLAAMWGGLGIGLRVQPGPQSSATYLLDIAGWLFAVAGAIVEARVAGLFFDATPRAARRRATTLAILGVGAAIGGCVLASVSFGETLNGQGGLAEPIVRGLGGALMVGGIGAGLAGLGSLVWVHGTTYAANRISERAEDDW